MGHGRGGGAQEGKFRRTRGQGGQPCLLRRRVGVSQRANNRLQDEGLSLFFSHGGGMVPCQGRPVNSPRMAACFGLWGLWRERNHSLYSWVDTVQVSSGVTRWRRGRTPA